MNLRDALAEASRSITRRDAETLLLYSLRQQQPETDRAWMFAHSDQQLSEAVLAHFRSMTTRRAAHEPLQHLTGVQEFFGLSLRVTHNTLIPRPETEHLVEAVLLWAKQHSHERSLRVADVGTGSGAIAIALATRLPAAEIFASDNSAAALAIAQQNALVHGCFHRIHFVFSNWLDAFLPAKDPIQSPCSEQIKLADRTPFDVIVSNPPYIALGDASSMQPEVVDFEPHCALFAGDDGLAAYRQLLPQAHAMLRSGGLLAIEFGFGQRDGIHSLLSDAARGWHNIRSIDDYAGIPRIMLADRA